MRRHRRLRSVKNFRNLMNETYLKKEDLVQPLFVCPGENIKKEIDSMPGIYQMSIDILLKECKEIYDIGIPAVILFGIPSFKDEIGSESLSPDGIIAKAIKSINSEVPKLSIIADVCLCEYTTHGHCGILKNERIHNDETIEILAKQALNYARRGASAIAPSDMMDGRVRRIRHELDKNGYCELPIISYSAKFASSFYAPFRDAAESSPSSGNRNSYQIDPANRLEALREVETDISEGADVILIKPGLSYLDIVRSVKDKFNIPVAVYNVSGEYSMVKAAALNGWIDEKKVVIEMLLSMKRAGADFIFTYFAKEVAKIL